MLFHILELEFPLENLEVKSTSLAEDEMGVMEDNLEVEDFGPSHKSANKSDPSKLAMSEVEEANEEVMLRDNGDSFSSLTMVVVLFSRVMGRCGCCCLVWSPQ